MQKRQQGRKELCPSDSLTYLRVPVFAGSPAFHDSSDDNGEGFLLVAFDEFFP
jgi:hypothetical protein